jgi:hypothetical protein
VVDAQQQPAAAMLVALGGDTRLSPTMPTWCLPTCWPTSDGAFSLAGVPSGVVIVRAASKEHIVERSFTLREGETVLWCPVLQKGGELRGTLTVADGGSPAACRVQARTRLQPPRDAAVAADGSFQFDDMLDGEYELLVMPAARAANLVLHRQRPVHVGERVALTLPTGRAPQARLQGRVLVPGAQRITLTSALGTCAQDLAVDGGFACQGLPAGDYHLTVSAPEACIERAVSVAAGASLDLGTLVAEPPVSIEVTLPGTAAELVDVQVHDSNCLRMVSFARARQQRATLQLVPNRYWLHAYAEGVLIAAQPIVVTAAVSTLQLDPLPVGTPIELQAALAMPSGVLAVAWRIDGPNGTIRCATTRSNGVPPHAPCSLWVMLAPGDYRVQASAFGGPVTTLSFTVPRSNPSSLPPLLLQ